MISEPRMNGEGPSSPQSGDSTVASSSLPTGLPTNITPSITLIPIKQVCYIISLLNHCKHVASAIL